MMKKSREIWLLLDSSNFGGIESHVLQLANGLKPHAKVTVVFWGRNKGHPLVDQLERCTIDYFFLESRLANFIEFFYKQRPSVIHTHGYKAGVLARLLSIFTRTGVVSTFHSGEKLSGRLWLYDWLDRYSSFLSHHVFSVSEKIAKRIPVSNDVVKNFVDAQGSKLSQGSKIGFVGRLSYEKGPDLFCELARNFRANEFHIYGDGPMFDELSHSLPKNVTMHGQKKDMLKSWEDIGVLVVSSRQEGMPMVVIEAMSRGVPVIAFDVGDIYKIVKNGLNGWLVARGNMDEMMACLDEWINLSVDKKNRIAAEARKTVLDDYSSEAVVPKYLSVYRDVCRLSVGQK